MSFSPPTDIFLCKFQCELSTKKEKKICFAFCSQLKIETKRSEIKKKQFRLQSAYFGEKNRIVVWDSRIIIFCCLAAEIPKGRKKTSNLFILVIGSKTLAKIRGHCKTHFLYSSDRLGKTVFFCFSVYIVN